MLEALNPSDYATRRNVEVAAIHGARAQRSYTATWFFSHLLASGYKSKRHVDELLLSIRLHGMMLETRDLEGAVLRISTVVSSFTKLPSRGMRPAKQVSARVQANLLVLRVSLELELELELER